MAATAQLSTEEIDDAWRWNLDTYASRVSRGKWVRYRWHLFVARQLVEAVLAGNKRIIITAPPRHGKSELTARWLATWYLDLFPDKSVILASYGASLATDWSEKVRNTFNGSNDHTWARLNLGHANKDDWQTTEGGGMQAVGVDGGITGFGGDLVLIDDPHKDWAAARSVMKRQHVIDWFKGTLYPRLEPDATIVLIQTRWNEGDLAGYLLDGHDDDWIEIRLPALAEVDDPLGREVGEALCPERYDAERLEKIKKAVGPQVFAGLFQQQPAPDGGTIFDLPTLRFWYRSGETPPLPVVFTGKDGSTVVCDQRPLPPLFDEQCTSWDMSFKGMKNKPKKKPDFVVGQAWARCEADKYLIDQVRKRMGFKETLPAFVDFVGFHAQAQAQYVEDAANGPAIISMLDGKVSGLDAVTALGSKESRAEAITPMFNSGNVYLPHPSQPGYGWVKDLIDEMTLFPNGRNDDQVDAMTQALLKMKRDSVAQDFFF